MKRIRKNRFFVLKFLITIQLHDFNLKWYTLKTSKLNKPKSLFKDGEERPLNCKLCTHEEKINGNQPQPFTALEVLFDQALTLTIPALFTKQDLIFKQAYLSIDCVSFYRFYAVNLLLTVSSCSQCFLQARLFQNVSIKCSRVLNLVFFL